MEGTRIFELGAARGKAEGMGERKLLLSDFQLR